MQTNYIKNTLNPKETKQNLSQEKTSIIFLVTCMRNTKNKASKK